MAYTLEEQVEELQKTVDTHEDLLGTILAALLDEDNLSFEARSLIKEAYDVIYGNP